MVRKVDVNDCFNELTISRRAYLDESSHTLFFNWTLSSVEFAFTGKKLVANFLADCGIEIEGDYFAGIGLRRNNWPYYGVLLDGSEDFYKTFVLSTNLQEEAVTLFESDNVQSHLIKVVKLSENYKTYGGIKSFEMDGTIKKVYPTTKGKIEFVGDSITCGFGNCVKDSNTYYHSIDENGFLSYGAVASRLLNMEPSIVSIAGICSTYLDGMPNEYAMDELYEYVDRPNEDRILKIKKNIRNEHGELDWSRKDFLADSDYYRPYDFKKDRNNIVVINLGTNDINGILLADDSKRAKELFLSGYEAFIKKVRRLNGRDTHIICALGPMEYYLFADIERIVKDYIKETSDKKISTYRFTPISPKDGFGIGRHPSLKTHEIMGMELAEEVRRLRLI